MTDPKAELLGDLAGVSIEAGVSAFTGEPFMIVRATRPDGAELYGQLSPDEVRAMAAQWFAEAATAELDASLFGMLVEVRSDAGDDDAKATAAGIVNAARDYRHRADDAGGSST